ncbi:hypothetical protein ACHAWF_004612, partial [Thalassiosira exigua]
MTVADGRAPPPRGGGAVVNDGRGRLFPRSLAADWDGDGDMDMGTRSLALVPAEPLPGQTMAEVTKGVHTYRTCDTGVDDLSMYENIYFCDYRNTTMPYVVRPRWVIDESTTGVRHDCPAAKEGCHELSLSGLSLDSCLEWCGNGAPEGGSCSDETACARGSFCRRPAAGGDGGTCAPCPAAPEDCLAEGPLASRRGCLECDPQCHHLYWGETAVDGESLLTYALTSAPFDTASGTAIAPIAECSDLVLDRVDTCPGAEGAICLVEDYVRDSFFYLLARKCAAGGGVAMILYYSNPEDQSDDLPGEAYLMQPVTIPAVRVSYNDGVALRETKLGAVANVTTYRAGVDCWKGEYCSKTVPCLEEGEHCLFSEGMDEGMWCVSCPEDPLECFFSGKIGEARAQNEVEACVAGCASDLEFGGSCKTCGRIIASELEFGIDDAADACRFCPMEDVKHPDRALPLFSSGDKQVKCWQVQSFFNIVDLHKDTKNCKLAQMQNYVCGCEGTGYAGANTEAKQNALVWVPRTTAILSGLVRISIAFHPVFPPREDAQPRAEFSSSFPHLPRRPISQPQGSLLVLIDVVRLMRTGRGTFFHQLMAQMSAFDIVGSVAYAFTTLPIPSRYHFQGAQGNEATCTAQGFFIQVGTVACYTNVSLAFYYFFVIQRGWSETRLKKKAALFLVAPIVVGLAFAFAGIPFYDNMLLWCNNSAGWWPDIPVAIAILLSTVVMGSVCWDVRKKHQASKRWRQGGGGGDGPNLQTRVFWQSFYYLMSFYMTWPPYLALQYFWASGREYDNYGFILYAGTVVPLQGVWNFFVYARNRQLKRLRQSIVTRTTGLRSSLRASGIRSSVRTSGIRSSVNRPS